mmetsp:Transcript_18400/g.27268  ORF Transcript_18400/g.27268 Transcript_18400/m.27268 type:complete len:360 (+) Transcript_18400:29-1108(+)
MTEKKNTTDEQDNTKTTLVSHKLQPTITGNGRLVGGFVISSVLFCLFWGPLIPVILVVATIMGHVQTSATIGICILSSMAVARHSPTLCRCFLQSCGYFTKGVTVHYEPEMLSAIAESVVGSLWCMHPHGTSLGMGFTLNGAIRFRAHDEERYVHPQFRQTMPQTRLRAADGVQAPVLFNLPLVRNLLKGLGCCTPATKKNMFGLWKRQADFGILPGGMEEVALYQCGRERVYLSKRAGFIKYGLQNGALLLLAYTFGESDLYQSLSAGTIRQFQMWTLNRFGFIIPIFWGPRWYLPWLPRDDFPIDTVVGSPMQLPHIPNPTTEDVVKYHTLYMKSLRELFDRHKSRFGYEDRELEIL